MKSITRTLVVDEGGALVETKLHNEPAVDYHHKHRTIYWDRWANENRRYVIFDPSTRRFKAFASRTNACKGIDRALAKVELGLVRLSLA